MLYYYYQGSDCNIILYIMIKNVPLLFMGKWKLKIARKSSVCAWLDAILCFKLLPEIQFVYGH